MILLVCINLTPNARAQPNRISAVSRPVVLVKPSSSLLGTTKPSRPQRAQDTKVYHVRCDQRLRYGKHCLGRVIGPQLSHQRLRCFHCGRSVLVKRLEQPWESVVYDSDLRPHTGHYRQKDQIWICRHCGYASHPADFHQSYNKRAMEDALRRIRRVYTSEGQIPAHYRFRAANASYVARQQSIPFFATLMLQAMWATREENDQQHYAVFQHSAVQALRLSLQRKLVAKEQRVRMAFQLADLLRQRGEWLEATYWLEQADIALQQLSPQQRSLGIFKKMNGWILRMQQRISKREKDVYQLR